MDDVRTTDARKEPQGPDDLAPWFRGRKRLLVAKGKKYADHTLRGLSADEKVALVLGPSGKLRAPTFVVGDLLVVGYNEEVYDEVFG